MAYGRVEETIWSDQRVRRMPEDARWLFLYLLTCPHRNRLGCFVLDPYYAAGDLQWDAERVQKALRDLEEAGRILYDPEVRVVLIRAFLKHNVLINPNVVKGARNDLRTIPDTPLLEALREELRRHAHRSKADYGKLFRCIETRCETTDGNDSGNDSPNDLAIYHTHTSTHNHTHTQKNPHHAHAREEAADVENSPTDRLSEWLGEHAHVLDGTPLNTAKARNALHDQFVGGLWPGAWKHPKKGESIEPEKRPRLMAAALSGYFGAEGKRELVMGEFAGMLRRLVRDETNSRKNGTGSDSPDMTDAQHERYLEIRRELEADDMDPEEAAPIAAARAREEVPA